MRRTLRLLAVLAIVAIAALGSSGCSDSGGGVQIGVATVDTGSSGGSNTADDTIRDQAVHFAECMRANGVREFPDPDASGALTIETVVNGSSLDTDSAAFAQARSACQDLEPSGFTGSTRSPEQQQAAIRFAQCIRDNGVTDFPDPDPDGPMIDTNRIPSTGRSGGMDILHAAMQACSGSAAEAGVTGS